AGMEDREPAAVADEEEGLAVASENGHQVRGGPEGELGLALRVRGVEQEELGVAADAPVVDNQLAVRRPRGVRVVVIVVRQVRDRLRLQIEPEDVEDACAVPGEEE